MRQCVQYIHELYMTLTFDHKVQIRVRAVTSLFFDTGITYLAHGCITIRRCVDYHQYFYITLTFDPKVKIIGFFNGFVSGL